MFVLQVVEFFVGEGEFQVSEVTLWVDILCCLVVKHSSGTSEGGSCEGGSCEVGSCEGECKSCEGRSCEGDN